MYYSRARTNINTRATAPSLTTGSFRSTATTNIGGLTDTMETLTATTADGKGVTMADNAGFNHWNTNTSGTSDFSVLGDIEQKMNVISGGTYMGIANVEAIIDIFRVLDTTTGANPSGTVGQGSYVTTLVLTLVVTSMPCRSRPPTRSSPWPVLPQWYSSAAAVRLPPKFNPPHSNHTSLIT